MGKEGKREGRGKKRRKGKREARKKGEMERKRREIENWRREIVKGGEKVKMEGGIIYENEQRTFFLFLSFFLLFLLVTFWNHWNLFGVHQNGNFKWEKSISRWGKFSNLANFDCTPGYAPDFIPAHIKLWGKMELSIPSHYIGTIDQYWFLVNFNMAILRINQFAYSNRPGGNGGK